MDRALTARRAVATHWGVSLDTATVTNLPPTQFPWAKRYLFYISVFKYQRMLIAVDANDLATVFPPIYVTPLPLDSARSNQEKANRVFADENVVLPAETGLNLPWTARAMLAGLGGWVGSRAFWDQAQQSMQMWISKRPDDGRGVFEDYCREPVLTQGADGLWTYDYYYFNPSGGVESWKIQGDTRRLQHAEVKMALPNGTWLVPYG